MSIQLASILAGIDRRWAASAPAWCCERVRWHALLDVCVVGDGRAGDAGAAAGARRRRRGRTSAGSTRRWWPILFPLLGLLMAPIYPVINSVVLSALPKPIACGDDRPDRGVLRAGRHPRLVHHRQVFAHFDGNHAFYFSLLPMLLMLLLLFVFRRETRLPAPA